MNYIDTFKKIYNQHKNSYNKRRYVKEDQNHSIVENEKEVNINKLRDLYFLEDNFIKTIDDHLKHKRKIVFDDETELSIYYDQDSNNAIMNIEEELINNMKKYYIILREYMKSGIFNPFNPYLHIKPVTIHYYPLNIPKVFPTNSDKIFTPRHVNTGCTYIENGEIYLWRQEEILKVFIHELMHAWKFDYGIIKIQDQYITDKIKRNTIVKDSVNLNEAYNEIWAELFLLLFHNSNDLKKKINREIQRQSTYNFYQIDRIREWIGMKDWKDLFIKEKQEKQEKQMSQFPQNTNVFSYYCLKGIIWNKLDNFIENMEKWGRIANGRERGIIKNKSRDDISKKILDYFYQEMENSCKDNDQFYKKLKNMRNVRTNGRKREQIENNFRMMYIG
jgi:hypothetical protein